jgi:diguanylate cyclase (GGDEF)-like protein/PAS domain S-box-containing protein
MNKKQSNKKESAESVLIRHIKELEEVISQMQSEKNESELLTFPWLGNMGQWYWMVQSNKVVFNEKKVTNLGYEMSELPEKIGFDFFTDKLHPDDFKRVMDNMRSHLANKSDTYEVEYRIRTKSGEYVWYYDRGKVTERDENGKAIVVSGIVFDISKNKAMEDKLRKANEKLSRLVITDELTGAFNRRYMLEKIDNEIKRYNRSKLDFSLIMLDIDRFKLVNDNFGHNVGDIALQKIVETINKRIRTTDILARWGGEEFVLLLPNTDTMSAKVLAENIRTEVSDLVIEKVGNITISLGVSNYSEGDSTDALIKKSDDLMYLAKSAGGNCVR